MKLSGALNISNDNMRIRAFTLGGQSFKVRVPLASEMEVINSKVSDVDSSKKFKEMMAPLLEKRDELESESIKFVDDDAILDGKSIKELAKLTVQTEQRITQMVRLLVPAADNFDMNQIEYSDINSEFPFAIQLELMRKIAEVIAPGYEETRKN
jgi:hypothetical protein